MVGGERANQSGRAGADAARLELTSVRAAKLAEAWERLVAPSPVLVCGPRHMGRRHLVREIELRWLRERGGVVARAHLGVADSPGALLHELARSLGVAATSSTDFLHGLRGLAAAVKRPLLLEVSGYEAIVDDAQRRTRFGDTFRDVAAQMAFRRFSGGVALLLLGEGRGKHLAGRPDYYRREIHVVELDAFTAGEAGELTLVWGLDGAEFAKLWAPTGGVPGLLVPALAHALRAGANVQQLVQQAASPDSPFGPVFVDLSHELQRDPEAKATWRSAVRFGVTPCKAEVAEKLFRLGLAVVQDQDGGGHSVLPRCPLFKLHIAA
ncbi:MAG TPA: AAA-like domain-containing protein [Polyangiaceae bacterium]|nr:AAA-like domain-containing protein [Polyangiaceae bacterium]